MVDKSTNKVQFRQMKKSIQKISTIVIQLLILFHDQTISIANYETLTKGNSLGNLLKLQKCNNCKSNHKRRPVNIAPLTKQASVMSVNKVR